MWAAYLVDKNGTEQFICAFPNREVLKDYLKKERTDLDPFDIKICAVSIYTNKNSTSGYLQR